MPGSERHRLATHDTAPGRMGLEGGADDRAAAPQHRKPSAGSVLQKALRGERLLLAGALGLVIVLAWGYLLGGAGTLQEMGGMLMPMSSGPWTPRHAGLMLLMWAVMMAAMMLPGAAPMILLFASIARRRRTRGGRAALSGVFGLGYLVVWSAFSLGAVALQFALERLALLSPMMQTTSVALAGAVLIAAGVYQWTPFKQGCLRRCRSPLDFLLAHWRGGPGALSSWARATAWTAWTAWAAAGC